MEFNDYLQIKNLMFRYAHLMDQADFDGVGEIFAHADVYLPNMEPFRSDPAGLAAMFREWNHVHQDTGTLRTRHVTTNVLLESDEPDRAKSQSYVVVFQATRSMPLQAVIAGTYLDRFEKVGGLWRFSERREEAHLFELLGDLSNHLKIPYEP